MQSVYIFYSNKLVKLHAVILTQSFPYAKKFFVTFLYVFLYLKTELKSCICFLPLSQTKLGVVPDSMAAGLLRAVSRLLDMSVQPIDLVMRFLSQCCLSLLALLITLQQEAPAETNHRRCVERFQSFAHVCLKTIFFWILNFDRISFFVCHCDKDWQHLGLK